MDWFYVRNGQQQGPVGESEFQRLVQTGTITASTMVWHAGMSEWQQYGGLAAVPAAAGGTAICSECGKTLPSEDLIQVGNSRVCAACKPLFLQKLREGVTPSGNYHYAGFWIRAGAVILDGLLLWVVQLVVMLPFGVSSLEQAQRGETGMTFGMILAQILSIALPIAYETYLIGKYGATLGKMAVKIHVITSDGGRVSYMRAFGRYFAKIVSGIILGIGYLMAGFDAEKRALHDRMCDTRVVYK